MDALTWEQIPIRNHPESDCREATGPEGRWWLSGGDRRDCRAALTLAIPEGMTAKSIMDSLPDFDPSDLDQRKRFSYISSQSDILFAMSMDRLVALIERLRDPAPARGTVTEILNTAGFVPHPTLSGLLELDIGKGTIWAQTEQGLQTSYHGNMPWWLNIFDVSTAMTTHDGRELPFYWPESYGDVCAKGAEYLVDTIVPWVKATRITRKRFY